MLVLSVLDDNAVNSISLVFFQVWDNMIIESALKTFYGSDISIMIQTIQRNITVIVYLIFLFIYSNDGDTQHR